MASDLSKFDPYHKWFGIPPDEQPPHHYRLLRIAAFESDPDVIDNAYDTAMSQLKRHEVGEHGDFVEQLGREFLVARRCLLSPEKKEEYDRTLREQLSAGATSGSPPPRRPTSPPPLVNKRATRQHLPEVPVAPSQEADSASLTTNTGHSPFDVSREEKSGSHRRRRGSSSPKPVVLGLLLGGFACVALILIGVAVGRSLSNDPGDEDQPKRSDAEPAADWRAIDWTAHGIRDWGPIDGKDEIVVPREVSPNSWLLSRRTFDDFVLTAQYAVEEKGAGGIYVRVPQDARFPWNQGFEIHFDDDHGELPSLDGTGSVYKRAQPQANLGRPVNQWNDVRIECRGRELSVWLNDERVVDYRIPDTFPMSGHVGLDGVTGGITYRNVRVRRLSSDGK